MKLSPRSIRWVAGLLRGIYWLLQKTMRPVLLPSPGLERILAGFDGPERMILAIWHDRLAMAQTAYRGPGACILVSRHADGELLTRALEPLGLRTARGSTTRGGVSGARELVRAYDEGWDLVLTVDGPRGPRHVAKAGALHLARITGAPIYPIGVAPRRAIVFRKSWDRFHLPIAFTRLAYWVAEPIRVGRDDERDDEGLRQLLEERLREATERASRFVGRAP